MPKQTVVAEASLDYGVPSDEMWKLIISKEVLSRVTGLAVRSDVSDNGGAGSGVLTVGKGVFFLRYSPCDIDLSGTKARIKLRVVPAASGCRVAVAAALPEDSDLNITSERLGGFLRKLKEIADGPAAAPKTRFTFSPTAERGVSKESETPSREYEYAPHEEYEWPQNHGENPKSKKGSGGVRALAVLTLLFALFYVAALGYTRFGAMDVSEGASALVTLESARDIYLGMPKSRVAFLLGTNGAPINENRVAYGAVPESDGKIADGIISVEYNSSGRAESVSYLNHAAAVSVIGIIGFDAEITPDMSAENASAALNLPFSLIRRYESADGKDIEEVHFGYMDPTANFDPAWRGEFQIVFNRTDGSVSVKNWGHYDGSDPTMTGSIENTPFANQYDSYTDFLNDRFHLNRSFLLLNGYSLGDTKFFFDGEPVHYSDDFGYQFYSVDSEEKLADSDIPLYRISIGYDNRGAFRMASFSNMRLYEKTGTLRDSDYRGITRGMSYSEVRSLMRLVPSAIYIDANSFSVCYGRFLNTDVADEQFEVIVRFDLENYYAQKVLINTAVSSVTDSAAVPAETEDLPGGEAGDAA